MLSKLSLRFGVLLFAAASFAQTGNTVVGAGYSLPIPINAAPGQIMNLFVEGVGGSLTQAVFANGLPLPTMLAGISVELKQSIMPLSVAVPLVAVRPVSTCLNPDLTSLQCGRFTVVTIQMPFELAFNSCPQCVGPPIPNPHLVVSENGVAGGAIDVIPLPDQVHVANLCDIERGASVGCGSGAPLVTHADGSLVSAANPAKLGEEIVMYALGLGATKPAVATGHATPSPAPVAQTVGQMNFDYQPNEGPSIGGLPQLSICYTLPVCPFMPAFVGLTPGSVGLYQVNVVIPLEPQPTVACGPVVNSNLTLTIVGSTSFDGAGICVAVANTTAGTNASQRDKVASVSTPGRTIRR